MSHKHSKSQSRTTMDALAGQELRCTECISNDIAVIRKSVIANEAKNNQMRDQIDEVFELCRIIQKAGPSAVIDKKEESSTSPRRDLPQDSNMYTIKHLAFHLQKLAILNAKLKQRDMDHYRKILEKKISLLESKVEKAQQNLTSRRDLLDQKQAFIESLHRELSTMYNERILRYQLEDARRVSRQASILQYDHYKVIRQVAFQKFDAWLAHKTNPNGPPIKLDFYGQSIIPLESFLLHNNKLIAINIFLENMIRFQILLKQILNENGSSIDLPFVSHLERQLPDEGFYAQVQEKINFLLHESDNLEYADQPEEVLNGVDDEKERHDVQNTDKIVVKDNVIQVPLSFKTANFQRRASTKSNSLESPVSADQVRPEMFLATPEPSIPDSKHPGSEKTKNSAIQGKKMVIVPHKILTKPFTKLTLKEYLKFILIVAKIIINFEMLLRQTVDKVPRTKRKKPTSNLLMSTYGQSRAETDPVRETEAAPQLFYDFGKILLKFAEMDGYFKLEIDSFAYAPSKAQPASSIIKEASSRSTIPSSAPLMEAQEPSHHASNASLRSSESRSRLREFYSNFIDKNSRKSQNSRPSRTSLDNQVYGAVSDGFLDTDEDESKASTVDSDTPFKTGSSYSTHTEPLDIKEVINAVHNQVANGKGGGRGNGEGGDEAVKIATKNIMKKTQSQLSDWDVVSRLF